MRAAAVLAMVGVSPYAGARLTCMFCLEVGERHHEECQMMIEVDPVDLARRLLS